MVKRKTWKEFRRTGLLLIINQLLHIFGWAIVFEVDDNDSVTECYPARVKFRGFDNDSVTDAYTKVSDYMVNNAKELRKDCDL